MEYTLQELNQKSNLGELKLSKFTEDLNLIGNEVDELIFEQNQENIPIDDVRVILKVPANREDLMSEIFLLNDLSKLFSFTLKRKWNKTKKKYTRYFRQKYNQSQDYEVFPIVSLFSEIKTYIFKTNLIDQTSSPKWIQKKLSRFGEKSESLHSDIIQLIFLEWGQKFNSLQMINSLENCSLSLKRLEKDSSFITPLNNTIELPKGTFVIFDQNQKIINCFGYSEITRVERDNPNSLIFQLWFYDIHTNEYNVNPIESQFSLRVFRQSFYETIRYSIQRLFTLLEITSQQDLKIKVFRSNTKIEKTQTNRILSLRKKSAQEVLNLQAYNLEIFNKAGLKLACRTTEKLYFQISNIRKDLQREIDLIEEYSRFIGYQNCEEITPTKKAVQVTNHNQKIKSYFLINGFQEIQTSPLQNLIREDKKIIQILNPISNELKSLRSELVSSCLTTFEINSRIRPDQTRFFEMGRTFQKVGQELKEFEKVGGVFQIQFNQMKQQKDLVWFEAKALIENFLEAFGYPITYLTFSSENFSTFSFSHPTRSIKINFKKKTIGIFGQINPQQERKINSKSNTYFFEFDLNYFSDWQSKYPIELYQDYSKYPSIVKDLSFVFPKKIVFSKLKKQLLKKFSILKRVNIFDLYFDKENSVDIRLGLRLEFQSTSKTLLTEEVDEHLNKISKLLIECFAGKKVG